MGFTIPEIKIPVPPNARNEIQSFVGMLNLIICRDVKPYQLGDKFIKINQQKKHRIFLI